MSYILYTAQGSERRRDFRYLSWHDDAIHKYTSHSDVPGIDLPLCRYMHVVLRML